jgi:hypothetical protein
VMPKVRVLLSLYEPNTEYLVEQLKSLKNQIGVEVSLSVRFDYSNNIMEVKKLVLSYFPDCEFFRGKNLGASLSFIDLLKLCSLDSDYFCFCDQDDFWYEDKLLRASNSLTNDNAFYKAYCSTVEIVDEKLSYISSGERPQKVNFSNAIVENVITGCTLFFNKNLLSEIRSNPPKYCSMHDAWFYLFITAFGTLKYDSIPSVKYRQHGNNVVGSSNNGKYYLKKIKGFLRSSILKKRETLQLEEFLSFYGELLTKDKRKEIEDYIAIRYKRFQGLFYYNRNSTMDNVLLKIKIIFGLI